MAEIGEEKKWTKMMVKEVKKGGKIAAPMVGVSVMQYMLQVVSVIMVGKLGQLSLATAAIATSLTNVSGFSLLSGMAGGLETLCGQAYGAQQYHKLGLYTCSSIISLLLVCSPVCMLWIFMDELLILIGQDPAISHGAQKFSMWLIPALFGSAFLKPLTRYLQAQSLIFPMLIISCIVLCVHIPLCWISVFKSKLGYMGAALAFSISTWVNVAFIGLYVIYSSACERTRTPLSKEAFLCIGQFFRLAVPSAIMVCLKWWAMEVLVLLSGLLPNPRLETSVLSICLTISTLHFTIPYGLGAAARVSNELGAGNPELAKVAAWAAIFVAAIEAAVVSITLFACSNVLGYTYSSDKEVVIHIARMAPFLCISIITDTLQAVFSGIARGSGWQHIGAYINLAAFYLVALPVGVILGFVAHLKGKGLWLGILAGSILQAALLSLITSFTNWKNQAAKARERTIDGSCSAPNDQSDSRNGN